MKCNVKGHLPDREVFGAVLPTFRGTNRKGKYRQAEETKRKLERLQKKSPSVGKTGGAEMEIQERTCYLVGCSAYRNYAKR